MSGPQDAGACATRWEIVRLSSADFLLAEWAPADFRSVAYLVPPFQAFGVWRHLARLNLARDGKLGSTEKGQEIEKLRTVLELAEWTGLPAPALLAEEINNFNAWYPEFFADVGYLRLLRIPSCLLGGHNCHLACPCQGYDSWIASRAIFLCVDQTRISKHNIRDVALYFAIYGNDHCLAALYPLVDIVRLSLKFDDDFFDYQYLLALNRGVQVGPDCRKDVWRVVANPGIEYAAGIEAEFHGCRTTPPSIARSEAPLGASV